MCVRVRLFSFTCIPRLLQDKYSGSWLAYIDCIGSVIAGPGLFADASLPLRCLLFILHFMLYFIRGGDYDLRTALHLAASEGKLEAGALQHPAASTVSTCSDGIKLHTTCFSLSLSLLFSSSLSLFLVQVISFLLDSRADPNFKDRWGGTALEDAIQNNHAAIHSEMRPFQA